MVSCNKLRKTNIDLNMLLEVTEFMNPYISRRGKWFELLKEDSG